MALIDVGVAFWVMLGLLLGFVFFVYLLIRRTLTGFKEGMKQSGKR
jgi:hypothetical protein